MKKRYFLMFILLAVIASSCGSGKTNSGDISISGAFALYPMTQKWAEEYMKINDGARIDISAGGAGKGMTDVLSSMIDLAMFSREPMPEEVAKGAWKIAVAKDAVLPTINSNSPVWDELKNRGLTKKEFTQIFIDGNISNWTQLGFKTDVALSVYTRSDACGAADMWARYMDGTQEDLKGVGVFGDPGIADAVVSDKNGVGFNNIAYAFDVNSGKTHSNLQIIPFDLNENGKIDAEERIFDSLNDVMAAIKNNLLPEPPARSLYLISKGKPTDKSIIDFLNFILTDGQKYVKACGYVELPEEVLKNEINKLK